MISILIGIGREDSRQRISAALMSETVQSLGGDQRRVV